MAENVLPFLHEAPQAEAGPRISLLHSRIDETPDPQTGSPRLRVIIPGKTTPEIYELTRLLVQPGLAKFLAEGFRSWARTVSVMTRADSCQVLNFRVGSFLATLKQEQAAATIDEAYWTNFIAFLNGPRQDDGRPWSPTTRAKTLIAVKSCIVALLDHPELGTVATALLDKSGFPHNPWPGRHTKNVPTEVLSAPERSAMIVAALGEIAALRERLEERDAVLETGRAVLEDAPMEGPAQPYRSEIGVCAARIAELFPDRLASQGD